MKRTILIFGVVALALVFLARERSKRQAHEAVAVEVLSVARGDILSEIVAAGKITPVRQAEVRGEKTMIISKVFVQEGETVRRGQPLAEIASSQWLEERLTQYQNAQGDLQRAERSLNLTDELFQKKAISMQQFEEVTDKHERAKSALKEARQELHLARRTLSIDEKTEAAPFLIRSPQEGEIIKIVLFEGQLLHADPKEPLVTIADKRQLEVVVEIDSSDLGRVKVGQRMTFHPPFGKQVFSGRLLRIASQASGNVGNLQAESGEGFKTRQKIRLTGQLDAADGVEELKIGLGGEVRIVILEKKDVLRIPLESILSEETDHFVYHVVNQRAEKRRVTLGLSSEDFTEITEGLQEGDPIITKGQFFVKDKELVTVSPSP